MNVQYSGLMLQIFWAAYKLHSPIPVAAPSKEWVYGRSLAGLAGSNPTGGINVCLSVVCCQVEVSASG